MIHFEQPHRSPYPGIGNENDLVYRPNLRAGIMNDFVKELKCPVCGEMFHNRWQTSLKAAVARREKCQKNLKYWESIKNDQRAYTNAYRWRNELREVEEYLKQKGVIK